LFLKNRTVRLDGRWESTAGDNLLIEKIYLEKRGDLREMERGWRQEIAKKRQAKKNRRRNSRCVCREKKKEDLRGGFRLGLRGENTMEQGRWEDKKECGQPILGQ